MAVALELGLIALTCLQSEQLRKDLEVSQSGQTMLIDKLIACCKEVRTTPVNRAYLLFGHLDVFLIHTPFHFRVTFVLQTISRTQSGHNDCLRRYEKNWRREGRSLQVVGTERRNAIPPTPLISTRVWVRP